MNILICFVSKGPVLITKFKGLDYMDLNFIDIELKVTKCNIQRYDSIF